MSTPEKHSSIAPTDMPTIHTILARDFADRYLKRSGFDRFAYAMPFDSNNPVCDYDTTWWPAKPNRLSESIGKAILGKMHGLRISEIDDLVATPFAAKRDHLDQALREYPVMLVNGHSPDLQAGLTLLGSTIALAHTNPKDNYQRNLMEMIRISHTVVTRGLTPIMIGRPRLPLNISLLRVEQLVVSPHLSFPINKQMIESGIPKEFIKHYNAKLRRQSIEVAQAKTDHLEDYRTLWTISPGGTPDFAGKGEHEAKLITNKVEPATLRFIGQMGCGLLPVYTKFGRGKGPTIVEVGDMVPPNEVTATTTPTMMADLAAFRRQHGETNVYYEEEC